MTSSEQTDYLLCAAIDLGTTYSGYTFSTRHDFKRDPTKSAMKQWIDPMTTMTSHKTSTCILFTEDKQFSKFGFEAEEKYMELTLDEEQHNWYIFRRFKMSLYGIESSDEEVLVEDVNGKTLPAMLVFSESIRYLKDSLLEECTKQNTEIQLDDIKWVLTVPAIWSDPAKTFMRTAAIKAGISSDMLTISLEPEAAAIFVKYLPVDRKVGGEIGETFQTFSKGSKYIVVDAGGGTIDITAHEVLKNGKVKEILKASGGNWGGTKVDENYMDFVKSMVGETVMRKIRKERRSLLYEISREFEIAKRTVKPGSTVKVNVRIPSDLSDIYESVYPGKSLRKVTTVELLEGKSTKVSFMGDKLRLESSTVESFFASSISNILCHISTLFQTKDGKDIGTVLLVGGFAESPMLFQAIREKFSEKRIIIPQEAAWSVLRGAVIFGHDSSLIAERKSKYTYGIAVDGIFDPQIHDEKHRILTKGVVRCKDSFSRHVEIDETITVGKYQSDEGYVTDDGNFNIRVFTSTLLNPTYVDEDDCSLIGKISFNGEEHKGNIRVQMMFSDTEIEVNIIFCNTKKSKKLFLKQ
ncbi:heat shock 70 kDa protein 12A-like [Saccostrea echinata]|uniref:heat shock 70 kDa protein 12A-like n=1 Tax=Saccostrea echinata TaxID=191078 RepID=UPI002A80E17F|nr:heat shock 70 kDa protein 12A-like [Saccostrea echinata]